MKDVMIDLETLGTCNNAVIIQIGACYFDRATGKIGKKLLINVDVESSLKKGFEVEAHTLYWWLEQSEDARQSLIKKKGVSVIAAIKKINTFLKDSECIWSHATFDYVKIEHHLNKLGIKPTFGYRSPRDLRTLVDITDIDLSEYHFDGVQHNALDDCLHQVKYTVDCLNKIKNGEKK